MPEELSGESGAQWIYAGFCRPFTEDELGLIRRLLIADSYGRFLRGRGHPAQFKLAVECFGEAVEREAAQRGLTPPAAVKEYLGQMENRCRSLDISCDWDQVVLSSGPDHRLRTQAMFLELLEQGLVYESGHDADRPQWAVRTSRFAEQCELDAAALPGWSEEAAETQRAAVGRVDGVEIRAVLPGAGDLVVFTPHADSIEQAEFVAVSPNHPQIGVLATDAELAELRDAGGGTVFVQTSRQVAVPGVGKFLSLVVTPSVDARFGPTAVLGVPDRDETDRTIMDRLKPLSGLSLGAVRVRSERKPAARYRLSDLRISREGAWGAPIPIVRCERCGTVPSPPARPPVEAFEPAADRVCNCPACGGPAERDEASLDWTFGSMWLWPSICSPENGDWAECQVIWSRDEGDQLLQQRLAARIRASLDSGGANGAGDPFSGAVMVGSLGGQAEEEGIATEIDLDEYIASAGGDAARLAILNAGSPSRSTHLYPHLLRHAERFVAAVQTQAGAYRDRPAPERIDPATRSRRRLAAWVEIAADKVTTHLEQLETHKAVYDVMHLQRRIESFEEARRDNGGLADADRDAIAWALVRLGRLSDPLVPHLAAQLTSQSAEPDGI